MKELKRQLGTDIVLTIVGNKIDLIGGGSQQSAHVPSAEAEAYARSVGARHFNTSAKDNVGVEELFYELANMMIQMSDAKAAMAAASSSDAASLRRSTPRRLNNGNALRVEGAYEDDVGAVALGDGTTAANRSRCCGGVAAGAAGDGGREGGGGG